MHPGRRRNPKGETAIAMAEPLGHLGQDQPK
jgi:hypothetical protein